MLKPECDWELLAIKKKIGFGKIYGFFHIGVMNNWEAIVEDQMARLKRSGLFDATDEIFVGISGSAVDVPYGTTLLVHNPHLYQGENRTLEYIHKLRNKLRGNKLWYIHTKGVSRGWGDETARQDWRRYMEYFVIDGWRVCKRVVGHYDACGVEWQEKYYNGKKHGLFSGNFWWANGDLISKIKNPLIDDLPPQYWNERHKAEFFLSQGDPRIHNFVSFNKDFYYESHSFESYKHFLPIAIL